MKLNEVFNGKTVLITGHTGFKGSWLTAWLIKIGANVVGIALGPPTEPSHYNAANISDGILDLRVDIRNAEEISAAIGEIQPDFVFHLAAQALVRKSYQNPLETWHVNLLGTLNVLEALRKIEKACAAVIITSDKCYDNVEWVWGYRETDAIGGPDPYSASKGAAELAIRSHIKSFFSDQSCVRIASARAGNVIGGGDWASDRIVPDCVKAWSLGESVKLRNAYATRPWQHVLEPLSGYLTLAMELLDDANLHGQAFNFGPRMQNIHSVLDLVRYMAMHWPGVVWENRSELVNEPYESGLLGLNCDKSLHQLKWHAVMNFEDTVRMTAEWYRNYYSQPDEISRTTSIQIDSYLNLARENKLGWAQ
jgi:CDP-glucose 4,6-dehydratase